jgi:hypothetical protein
MNTAQQTPQPSPIYPQFRFVEFSTRRLRRGLAPTRIEVIHSEGDHDELWLSAGDLNAYIRQFGDHEALTDALKAYGQGGRA